ncbi:MAG: phasin family protein [Candidatus Humimicrobiaceae bacterium]
MARALKEAYLASLGIMALTYAKAQKLSNELIKKGGLAKEKQQKFITDLLKEARKNTAEISKIINEKVEYLASKGEPLKEKQDKLIKDLQVKAKKTGAITEERIKEAVREVVAKSKDVREKSQKLVKDLKEKSASINEAKIEETLKKLDIPTKDELRKINARLDRLIKKLEKQSSSQQSPSMM